MKKSFVWDLPVRLFHWSLVVLICISFYTGTVGGFREMDYHMLSGYAILALVLFRILWGFLGSQNARFKSFLKGPSATLDYMKNQEGPMVGHNPLGGLSIVAIILALIVQVSTGLFANDDILLEGPLVHLVSYDTSRELTEIHEINRWIVVGLVVLHLLAVSFYTFVKKDSLIKPMITGWKDVGGEVAPERNNWILGAILLAIASGAVYYLVNHV
jgi:cytochrome b